jgi:hypothetical protein
MLHHMAFLDAWRWGMQCRSVAMAIIYRKSLSVSRFAAHTHA